jgi:D-aspartate ligase
MPTAPKVALDVRVPTVVLKFGHYPLHHGGIGAIRSLGRTGVPVYGVHEDRFAPAARSRYLTGRFVWPTDGLDSDALLDGLVAIGDRIAGRAVLVPTDDEASVFIAEHADALRERFRFAEPPPALPRAVASKLSLYRICHELGVPCPQAVAPTTRADIHAFLSRARFPVVVKADEAWELLRSGVRSTQIVAHPEDVLRVWERVEREGRGALLLQEHISDGEDWIFHGYCNERSECLVGFTGVKLRSYPAYAGPTTLGRCRANARLHDQATSLVRELSYRGIMDMDWRLDRRDGQYKLLDFNPRVGAQFRLFETPAGVDVVRAQHLDLTGRPVPPGSPP